MSSGHAVPFYCPYCGEEDIVPDLPAAPADDEDGAGSRSSAGEGHGRWACRSCLRAFRLSLTAIASPPGRTAPAPTPPVPAHQAGPPTPQTPAT